MKNQRNGFCDFMQGTGRALCAGSSERWSGQGTLLKTAFLSALVSALAAYHLLVIYGNGNADAVCEGLVTYGGADWALACGRWAIRYMENFSGSLVMPGIWIALYALCCGASAVLLSRLWGLEGKLGVCVTACLLTVNPTVIEQSLLQYMFMAWGISNLLSVLAVYLCCAEGRWTRRYLAAPLCIAVAFGLYQACVGLIAAAFCMTLILALFDGEKRGDALRLILRFAATALLGTALYFAILRVETLRYAVEDSERVALFSISGFLSALPTSLPGAYKTYAAYFLDRRLHRAHFYALLFAAAGVCSGAALLKLLKDRRVWEALLAALLLVLIPALSNLADILFPYNTPVLIMQYASMLVIPFALALVYRLRRKESAAAGALRAVVPLLAACVFWTYLVSANATYRVYDLSYRHMSFAVSSALQEAYALEDYSPDDVIAFAGFPDDSLLRQTVPAYRLAYGQYDNFAFWDGLTGLQYGRRNYLLYYFGIDGGHIYGHLYNNAVASEEFAEMPVWPERGSVRRVNSLILIKFSDNPTIFG